MSEAVSGSGRGGWRPLARRIRVPLGFAFAAIFLLLARPSASSMAWSLLLVAPGLIVRGCASGHVQKNVELAVTGPYAYTRNPLYLGSLLIALGFAVASRSLWIAILLAALFALIYIPVIRSEEDYLRGRFPEFAAYAKRVPRLLPRLTPARLGAEDGGGFSLALYLAHREYNALIGAAAIYGALIVRLYLIH